MLDLQSRYENEFEQNRHDFSESQFHSLLRRNNCVLGDRILPTFPMPYFLPMRFRQTIAEKSALLASALEKLSVERMRNENLESILPLDKELFQYASMDTGYSGVQLVLRMDALLDVESGEFKILEFNCGDPSGMGWNDALVDTFQNDFAFLPVMNDVIKTGLEQLCPALAMTLREKYREYTGNRRLHFEKKPYVALVCKRDSFIEFDFRCIADRLQTLGFDADIADPGDFSLDERLRLRGRTVDIVYRDIVDDFLGPKSSPGSDILLRAIEEQKICFLNPLASAAGDLKNVNALLRDQSMRHLFTDMELAAIAEHIPWTTRLTPDQVERAKISRQRLVLKPNLGFGGKGVLIGKEHSENAWETELQSALNHDYTLQEFVSIPEIRLPVQSQDRWTFESKKVNVNFWIHNGKFTGAFARVSDQSVINVGQGGGLIPVCWVD